MAYPHLVAGPGSPDAFRTRTYSYRGTVGLTNEILEIIDNNNLNVHVRYNLVCTLPSSTGRGAGKWVWQQPCVANEGDIGHIIDGNMQRLHANGMFTREDLLSTRYLKYYICNYILP